MDEPHNHDIGDDPSNQDNKPEDHSLNIIIYPYTDPVHDSPALNFPVIRKNMVDGKLLKFGRKVNKEVINDDYFITFQSKVVSRNHAEIWYKEGQVYVIIGIILNNIIYFIIIIKYSNNNNTSEKHSHSI